MITFNFDKNPKPCTGCKALSEFPNLDTYCLLGYATYQDGSHFPVNPCNRPINSDELLDLMNSMFYRDN